MLIIAFVAFAILLLAWLAAPNGEVAAMPAAMPAAEPVPTGRMGEPATA